MSYIQVLLVCVVLFCQALGDGCPYQECDCEGTEISCLERFFPEMPKRLTDNNPVVMFLDLDSNQITKIPAGSLPGNLSGINFNYNHIETIDDTAFDESIYTLQKLSFDQARFTQIPEAVFHLMNLTNLQIIEVDILEWNDASMRLLGPTMTMFSLDRVGLTTWPTWIRSMANLTRLTISGGSISFIPDDALELLAGSLTVLDLHNNSLSTLPQSLAMLTVLSDLYLDNNMITDVTYLPLSSPLQTVSLNNNRITDAQSLSSTIKHYATTINSLDINNNRLTSIPDLSFITGTHTLDLSFNHLIDSQSGSVPSILAFLNMGHNLLRAFPSAVSGLKLLAQLFLDSNNINVVRGADIPSSATMLDLSYNQISQLSQSSFPVNSSLNFIILNNNPLSVISPDAFSNLAALTELNIRNTKLTRMPLAITSLTALTFVDVSDSANLVCTCQEQTLGPKIIAMGVYNVAGDCGLTSVYNFFTIFSPQCPQET